MSPGISNGGVNGTSNDGAEGPQMTVQGPWMTAHSALPLYCSTRLNPLKNENPQTIITCQSIPWSTDVLSTILPVKFMICCTIFSILCEWSFISPNLDICNLFHSPPFTKYNLQTFSKVLSNPLKGFHTASSRRSFNWNSVNIHQIFLEGL